MTIPTRKCRYCNAQIAFAKNVETEKPDPDVPTMAQRAAIGDQILGWMRVEAQRGLTFFRAWEISDGITIPIRQTRLALALLKQNGQIIRSRKGYYRLPVVG